MTHEEIFCKVASAIRKVMAMSSRQTILYTDYIEETYGADSLDKVEIMQHLEHEIDGILFGFSDSELDRIKTVGDLVEEIERQLDKSKGRNGND